MEEYYWYLLKVSICIVVFYIFYILALKNSTFFKLNRLYLVSCLVFSFVIPILNLSIFNTTSNKVISTIIYPYINVPDYYVFENTKTIAPETAINWLLVFSSIYFTGIAILFIRLLFSIKSIVMLRNKYKINRIGRIIIVKTETDQAFSFFNIIVLPNNQSNKLILEHEMAHVRQYHWLDLVITEIATILLWFNPFLVLYKRSLKLQHEYLADLNVINNNYTISNYLGCMLKQVQITSISNLSSNFYCKSFKNRIIMITKNKTSKKYTAVYIIALPLVVILLFAFSGGSIKQSTEKVLAVNELITANYQPSISPVNKSKVTGISSYGTRKHPITKQNHFHNGIDFAMPEGEIVVSVAHGIVVEAKFEAKLGNFITIKHNNEFSTFYAHLKSLKVKVGQKVNKGDEIGLVGNTGSYSTRAHLHYCILRNGENVNPANYMP